MKWVLLALTLALLVVHQDFWNWGVATAPMFGYLPVGLAYHALYCVAVSFLLLLFVLFAWPHELEQSEPETPEARKSEGYSEH